MDYYLHRMVCRRCRRWQVGTEVFARIPFLGMAIGFAVWLLFIFPILVLIDAPWQLQVPAFILSVWGGGAVSATVFPRRL